MKLFSCIVILNKGLYNPIEFSGNYWVNEITWQFFVHYQLPTGGFKYPSCNEQP